MKRLVFLAAMVLASCGGEVAEETNAATDPGTETATESSAETTAATATKTTLETIPTAFRGEWDATTDEFACTTLSSEIVRVEEKGLAFYESYFEPKSITQSAADDLTISGTLEGIDEASEETYELSLADNQSKLSISSDDFEPYTYAKCQSVREVVLIPDEFRGTWAAFGSCDQPREDLMVIKPTQIEWQGETSNFTKITFPAHRTVEVEDDGQEEPYGISVNEGGTGGTLSGPGHSPIPLTRCSD